LRCVGLTAGRSRGSGGGDSPIPAVTDSEAGTTGTAPSLRRSPGRRPIPDLLFFGLVTLGAVVLLVLIFSIVIILASQSELSFRTYGLGYLVGTRWIVPTSASPFQVYGAVPFIVGTLLTSGIALLLGLPLALGSAIFVATQAPNFLRGTLGTAVELLAAIPSVVYGFWGIYVVVPLMRTTVDPALKQYLGWTGAFGGPVTGDGVLTSGIILAIMIVPTISAVSRETLFAVPASQREAALSLGATSWETTRIASLPYARVGIFGAIALGLGRALGETMAVTMTIGNRDAIPTSLLSQGQTISSLIANELTSNSGPLQYSAVVEAGLILLLISLLVNVAARLLLWRVSGGRRVVLAQ
jgi:phosphate transport system permease protein